MPTTPFRFLVIILLACVVSTKHIRSIQKTHLRKDHVQIRAILTGTPEWSHDLAFSKALKTGDDAIGYKDLGAGDGDGGGGGDGHGGGGGVGSGDGTSSPDLQTQTPQVETPLNGDTSGINSGSNSDNTQSQLPNRIHIMMTCGGCYRTLHNTETWTDLLIQSHLQTKTKNIRHLYALRGPNNCLKFPEFNFEPLAEAIFNTMTANQAVQLISIPHSSGGGVCGLVLDALHKLDKDESVLKNRVTLLSLDAGVEFVLPLIKHHIFHDKGFIGFYAVDSITNKESFNSPIAQEIKDSGGEAKEIKGPTGCNDKKCEHFAFFCHKPPPVDFNVLVLGDNCPKGLDDLESSYLDFIPFD